MKIDFLGIDISINKGLIVAFAFILAITLGYAGYLAVIGNQKIVIETERESEKTLPVEDKNRDENQSDIDSVKPIDKPAPKLIMVYVVGCVNNPGIVELEKGQMIDNVLKAAGGVTEDADLENINLVFKLEENVMIKVLPKKSTTQSNGVPQASDTPWGSGVLIANEVGDGVQLSDNQQENQGGKKININSANAELLDTLPYIGVETAKDIISYREKKGPYKTIEEIMNVAGIKESRFARIKDLITVE